MDPGKTVHLVGSTLFDQEASKQFSRRRKQTIFVVNGALMVIISFKLQSTFDNESPRNIDIVYKISLRSAEILSKSTHSQTPRL